MIICMSAAWSVFLASSMQFTLGNESVNTHNAVKRRWQFCALSIETLEGAVPFKLAFGLKVVLQAENPSAKEAESFACYCSSPARMLFCTYLIIFPGKISISPPCSSPGTWDFVQATVRQKPFKFPAPFFVVAFLI